MVAQTAHGGGQLQRIRYRTSTLADRAEVLAGVKAETPDLAHATRTPASISGAMGLARILDDRNAVTPSDRADRIHVCDLSIEMDGDDGARPRRDCGRQ